MLTEAQQSWFDARSPRVQLLDNLMRRGVRHRPLGLLHTDGTFESYVDRRGKLLPGAVAVGIEDPIPETTSGN